MSASEFRVVTAPRVLSCRGRHGPAYCFRNGFEHKGSFGMKHLNYAQFVTGIHDLVSCMPPRQLLVQSCHQGKSSPSAVAAGSSQMALLPSDADSLSLADLKGWATYTPRVFSVCPAETFQ